MDVKSWLTQEGVGPRQGALWGGRLALTGGLAHHHSPVCPQASDFSSLSLSVLWEAGTDNHNAALH